MEWIRTKKHCKLVKNALDNFISKTIALFPKTLPKYGWVQATPKQTDNLHPNTVVNVPLAVIKYTVVPNTLIKQLKDASIATAGNCTDCHNFQLLRRLHSSNLTNYEIARVTHWRQSEHQCDLAQWVARMTRDRWIPISREFEPHQRPPLFPW